MPNFCAVVGCGSRGNRDRNSFFRIPCIPIKGQHEMIALKKERRQRWILALRRKDLTETKLKYALICDRHFISGRPAATKDIYNLDWVPSQNMGYIKPVSPTFEVKEYRQATICNLSSVFSEHVNEENIESEIIYQNEDNQSNIKFTFSSETRTDQLKTLSENRGAIICHLKPSYVEQTQIQRTEPKTTNQSKACLLEKNITYFKNKQTDMHKKQVLNRDAIIMYLTPNHSREVLVKRTINEASNQNEDD